jgi:hypothetical protein
MMERGKRMNGFRDAATLLILLLLVASVRVAPRGDLIEMPETHAAEPTRAAETSVVPAPAAAEAEAGRVLVIEVDGGAQALTVPCKAKPRRNDAA